MSNNEHIHPELVQIALDKVEGFAFENFSQDFLSVLEGRSFIPAGGVKDGGADGIYDGGDERTWYHVYTTRKSQR